MDEFNVSANPHFRSPVTTGSIMRDVLLALAPAALFGIYNFGAPALVRIVVSVVVCVLCEYLFQKLMKRPVTVNDCSAAVTGLLLAMNVPSTLPIAMLIAGDVFAIIIVKQLFGGIGQNFMNPALAARCFLLISFPAAMTAFVYNGVSGATPLAILKPGADAAGGSVTLLSEFLGTTGGTIGETSALALLIGAAYLLARREISWRIPVAYIGTFSILIFFLAPGHSFDGLYLAQELCGGGLMLGAFFMATDYVTSPDTPNGKLIFGAVAGLLTFIFRMFGGSAEGVSYAIIFSNLLVPLIERVTVPKPFGYRKPEKQKAAGKEA
ncbi:MAG: RnfABCDGE type electron transport complex subunit D [Lachnospiraceae bacterium]|jgi:Na+-translocating ferredoxin:NAD+ oxidoreductase RnfD subunit|nr:RnfABCDGE type electron transport complex subunit D [Lachnospiraceae bacterium]MCH4030284.1 RnfABCDGE type electron transport complex subunit D [Lachnospiraceae bacterium]MCH4069496.1 RnfABCDGE type electron transport complex subunit D [Lachnospiraceae bacterium]MCH4107568.1 RnfABCDGE type electron transport complex subunit D [Lachnospiraceae bacterium]MCI1301581.1 RnfABCDGE type electron transport complex subunit D [Lachnospiraceae bacterium]